MPGLGPEGRRDIRDEIPQVGGLHAGVPLRPDLLLVGEDGHGREGRIPRLQDRGEGGIGADTVVVSVGADQAAVEAQVARLEGGDRLQLGGKEIRLGHAVFLMEDPQDVELDQLPFLIVAQRPGADEDIEVLPLTTSVALRVICSVARWGSRSVTQKTGSSGSSPTRTGTVVPSRSTTTPWRARGMAVHWYF